MTFIRRFTDRKVSTYIRTSHGPGIGVERATGKINQFLAQRERQLYQQMAQYRPELIIRLGIDIDTAISRKPDHDYAELQDKILLGCYLRLLRSARVKPFCWPIKNHWLPADVCLCSLSTGNNCALLCFTASINRRPQVPVILYWPAKWFYPRGSQQA